MLHVAKMSVNVLAQLELILGINKCLCYLDSLFEPHEVPESLLFTYRGQTDTVVKSSEFSGSDDLLGIHLDHSTIGCSPLTSSSRLKHGHSVSNMQKTDLNFHFKLKY